jgi:hypothetical protein
MVVLFLIVLREACAMIPTTAGRRKLVLATVTFVAVWLCDAAFHAEIIGSAALAQSGPSLSGFDFGKTILDQHGSNFSVERRPSAYTGQGLRPAETQPLRQPQQMVKPTYLVDPRTKELEELHYEQSVHLDWFRYNGIMLWFSLPSLVVLEGRPPPRGSAKAEWRSWDAQTRALRLQEIDRRICELNPNTCKPPQWRQAQPSEIYIPSGGALGGCEYSSRIGRNGCPVK